MTIKLDTYTKSSISIEGGTHETDSIWQAGGFIGTVRAAIKMLINWYLLKWIGMAVLIGVAAISAKTVDINKIEKASADFASGWYFSSISFVIELFDNKNSTFNIHPVYKTEGIQALENALKVNYKKLFWFVKYDGREYLLMREPVKNKSGEYKEQELDRFIGFEDAENICDQYGGIVPMRELVIKSNKLLDRIKGVRKGEMFSDSENEKGYFRCAVDISDFMGAE
jgi:hypothetical protein